MLKLNGHVITPTIFPDKTSQVWKLPEELLNNQQFDIDWYFEQESEFLWLAQLVDLIRAVVDSARINLYVPYFPYARQDKEVSNNTTFAKLTFIKLLNSLNLNNIFTIDIHSSTTWPFLKSHSNEPGRAFIPDVIRKIGPTVLVFPDRGAQTRYDALTLGFHTIAVEKVRNQLTGEITSLDFGDRELFKDDRVLIIDDLCDGGKTFIEVAKAIQSKFGTTEIHLYTSHGIYSKGIQVLKDAGIKRIFNYKGEVL